jgi:hypothetical protein
MTGLIGISLVVSACASAAGTPLSEAERCTQSGALWRDAVRQRRWWVLTGLGATAAR